MKNLFFVSVTLAALGAWSAASACPAGFQHLGNNLCYQGYVPSCPEMAQGVRTFLRIDLQRARAKLKSQRADTFQWLQRPADFRLLGAAVHGRDFEKPGLARNAGGHIARRGRT